jgi:aryl-alcohol dehydrogenase-like predicted oxidoreductase
MQYRTLGRTGIKVSPYALGTLIAARKRPESGTGQEAPAYDFTWQLTHHHAVDGAFNVPVPAGTQPESSAP